MYVFWQAEEWIDAVVQPKESEIPPRRVLLEKEERWQDHKGGSYEAQSSRDRGKGSSSVLFKERKKRYPL